jgi:hypothetical protein
MKRDGRSGKGALRRIDQWRRLPGGELISGGLALLYMLLLPVAVDAADDAAQDDRAPLEVHGFVSQGFILTWRNEYLAQDSTKGSFEFSELGINVTKALTDQLELGVQFFAQDLGPSGNHAPQVDWFYLAYRWRDWLGLRVGRLKMPYGLYNEVFDVDAARLPILLPGSVYPLQGREILFAHNGVELFGFARLRSLGALDYRLFAGTIFWDPDSLVPINAGFEADLHVRYVAGGRLLWETPLEGLRVGASGRALRAEPTFYIPGVPPVAIENQSYLWAASAEYSVGELVLTAEYARWYADQSSDAPDISPPLSNVSERAYAMASYRFTPWFQAGAYYALHFPNTKTRERAQDKQHDWAMTLRLDVNDHWLVKLEGHYMSGTAGLSNPLLLAPPDTTAEPHWAAFFAKTTAYF